MQDASVFVEAYPPSDLIEAAEAVARITVQSHILILGMTSTAHSVPALRGMLTDVTDVTDVTDIIDLFTPDAETCF